MSECVLKTLALTEALSPTPPRPHPTPRNGPETEQNGAKRTRNGPKWSRNGPKSSPLAWDGRGGLSGWGGVGVVREEENHYASASGFACRPFSAPYTKKDTQERKIGDCARASDAWPEARAALEKLADVPGSDKMMQKVENLDAPTIERNLPSVPKQLHYSTVFLDN